MLAQEAFRKVLVYYPGARALFEGLKPRKDGSNRGGGRCEIPLSFGPQSGRVTPTGHSSPKPEPIESYGPNVPIGGSANAAAAVLAAAAAGASSGALGSACSPKGNRRTSSEHSCGSRENELGFLGAAQGSPSWLRDGASRFAAQLKAGNSPSSPLMQAEDRNSQFDSTNRASLHSRTSTTAVWHGISSPLAPSPYEPSSRRDSAKSGSHMNSGMVQQGQGTGGNYMGNFGGGPAGNVGAPRGESSVPLDQAAATEYYARMGIPRIGPPGQTSSRPLAAPSVNNDRCPIIMRRTLHGRRMTSPSQLTWSDRRGQPRSPLVVLSKAPQRPRAKSTSHINAACQALNVQSTDALYRRRAAQPPPAAGCGGPNASGASAVPAARHHSDPSNSVAALLPAKFGGVDGSSGAATDVRSLRRPDDEAFPHLQLPTALRRGSTEVARRSSGTTMEQRRGSSEGARRSSGVDSQSQQRRSSVESGVRGSRRSSSSGGTGDTPGAGLATHHEALPTNCEWVDTHTVMPFGSASS